MTILELIKTFDREINIQHKQIPKRFLTEGENYHGTQNIKRFFIFACADILFLKQRFEKAINLAQNGNFSILGLFWRPFLLT